MKVQPIASSATAPQNQQSSAQQSARDRAIAAYTAGAAAQIDQNSVAAEDMSAISQMSDTGQNHTNEETAEETPPVDKLESSEAPKEPEEAPVEDPALSSQFAALARREKAMRAQIQRQETALRSREAALAAREAEIASKAPDLSQYIPKSQLKSDTLRVLAEEGVSYEELTHQILNQQPADPRQEARAAALEAKIAKLEAAIENSQKSQVTAQEEQYKAAVKQIEADTKRLVFTDPSYEMIKATNSVKDVVELIEATYKESGELLTVDEAAQQVEDYLVGEAEKLAKIDKIKKRLNPVTSTQAAATPVQKPSEQPPKQTQPMKTLTNSAGSSRQLSARERALLAFKGELK